MGEEVVKQAFNLSPATVYGMLVAVLILILLGAGWFFKSIYTDFKKTRVQEKEAQQRKEEKEAQQRKEEKEATNLRFRELHENNASLQKEYIEVLTNVVHANTTASNELVAELRSHREIGARMGEESAKAIARAESDRNEIKALIKELPVKLNAN